MLKNINPLIIICFLVSLDYYLLKSLKDAILLTAPEAGVEAIPFVKTWIVFPVTLFMAGVFSWALRYYSLLRIFKFSLVGFLGIYFVFSFFIYPNHHIFELHRLADLLQSYLTPGWYGLVALVRYWALLVFYVAAESWGTVFYCIIFWGIVNAVATYESAKVDFPRLMLAGNLSAIGAGALGWALSFNDWSLSVQALTLVIVGTGIAVFFLARHVEIPENIAFQCSLTSGLREGLPLLLKSKVLWSIIFLVGGYNMMMQISEVVWKDQILSFYPHPRDYHLYMQYVTLAIGIVSTMITLFLTGPFLERWGWRQAAMFTPVVYVATALLFIAALFSGSLPLAATLGSLHVLLGRSSKYTLFDTTKEMAYLQIPVSERLKIKSCADGIASRFGTGAASFYLQGVLLIFPTFQASLFYLALFLVVVTLLCCLYVIRLAQGVNLLASKKFEC